MSVGLAFVGLMPGLGRLAVELAGGTPATSANHGSAFSIPVIAHIVTGTVFAVLGAFQFPTAPRQGRRIWHRRAGRLLAPVGLVAAVTGLWLTLHPRLADSTALLTAIRLTFGTAMVVSIVLGFIAIRRRDVARHRDWMIRAYALGLGVATQVFTLGFGGAIFGSGDLSTALLTGAGWVINLAVAEWAIRQRFHRRPRRTTAVVVAQRQRHAHAPAAPLSGRTY